MSEVPSKEPTGTSDTLLPSAVRFSRVSEGSKMITVGKPGCDSKFHRNLLPIILLPTRGKQFEKVIMRIHVVQMHIQERGLLNASHIRSLARQKMIL
jgi:hypothetical protein